MLQPHVARKLGINEIELSKIKNIIFDLGGVIIDIRYNATIEQFKMLGFKGFDKIYTQIKNTHLFDLLETGKIEPETFRNELRKFKSQLTDWQIDNAWNAMIGEMPLANIQLIKEIRKQYRTFMLSNTNAIHIQYFTGYLNDTFGYNPLPEMFERVYFSHEIGKRKPDVLAYEFVLKDAGLNANETLFIDDLAINIEGAEKTGIRTYHLDNENIANLFQAL
jgi:putative hydrolase of the HAD superfamily